LYFALGFFLLLLLAFSVFIFIRFSGYSDNLNLGDNYVVEVIDGDTFKLANGEAVRLICVDAPERNQSGYDDAKDYLNVLILNREVRLESDLEDRDAYGRLLRYVYVGDVFVNRALVRGGYASIFRYGNSTRLCDEIEGD